VLSVDTKEHITATGLLHSNMKADEWLYVAWIAGKIGDSDEQYILVTWYHDTILHRSNILNAKSLGGLGRIIRIGGLRFLAP
jgi:hypothetical protein